MGDVKSVGEIEVRGRKNLEFTLISQKHGIYTCWTMATYFLFASSWLK